MARYIWPGDNIRFPFQTWLSGSQISDPTINIIGDFETPIKSYKVDKLSLAITKDKGLTGIAGTIWWGYDEIKEILNVMLDDPLIKPFDIETLDYKLLIECISDVNIHYTHEKDDTLVSEFVARSIRTRLYDRKSTEYRY